MLSRTRLGRLLNFLRRADGQRSFVQNLRVAKARILESWDPGRKVIQRSQLFDAQWYLNRYPDVAASRIDPLTHYLRYGANEGRNPNPLFDTTWYLETYPGVALSEINPLLHFAQFGNDEGLNPHPSFSTRYYLKQNPEVAESGMNALAHYLHVIAGPGSRVSLANAVYSDHVRKEQQLFAIDLPNILRHIDIMLYQPVFRIFITGDDTEARGRTLASVQRQVYTRWTTHELDWRAAERLTDGADEGTYFIFLQAGDMLNACALYEFADAINSNPSVEIVYGDEDVMDDTGMRSSPFYKPDWSPDTLESLNYIGPGACFAAGIAVSCWADAGSYYDFLLRVTERTSHIQHARATVCHRRNSAADPVPAEQSDGEIQALRGRLGRTGRTGVVTPVVPGYGCYDATVTSPETPLISVIIPTAGHVIDLNGKRLDLIFNCLNAIDRVSSYKNLEFIVVDNGNLGGDRVRALHARGCRTVTFDEQGFNISRKLNLGASAASGEMLILLNDDVEPHSPDWIERLLEHFEKPHVGVVGAKLIYSDMTLQHVGIATNHGNPEHVRRMYPADDRGYFFSTLSARNYSAVTGACMMVRADVFQKLDGYTEALAINYNDVDFCFKVSAIGLTTVYAPRAQLIHFESKSREPVLAPAENQYFQERWASILTSDPYYNEDNLEVLPGSFLVKHNPRWL